MFGLGKKKELFTLDKLFSGFWRNSAEIARQRESVGFREFGDGRKGEWSNMPWMKITDSESIEHKPKIIRTTIMIPKREYSTLIGILSGCKQIKFKFSDAPHPHNLTPLKEAYSGWILPSDDVLSEGYIFASSYYQFEIFNQEQIIIL